MRCTACPRDLADDVPVYRFRAAREGGKTLIQCGGCAARLAAAMDRWGERWTWGAPAPCEGCGRAVIDRMSWSQGPPCHVTCGHPACQRTIRAAAARARRLVPRECLGCAIALKPARGNARRYCSPACKQRAYRQRAAVTPPPHGSASS